MLSIIFIVFRQMLIGVISSLVKKLREIFFIRIVHDIFLQSLKFLMIFIINIFLVR